MQAFTGAALDFPAGYALSFFETHGMLGFRRKPWRTVVGGSRAYVAALLERSGAQLHLGLPVRLVSRDDRGVSVRTDDDVLAAFSSWGTPQDSTPKPDVVAPGRRITIQHPRGCAHGADNRWMF